MVSPDIKSDIKASFIPLMFPDGTLTLEQVIIRVEQATSPNDNRKRDLVSAVRLVAKTLQIPVEHAMADPAWLRARLAKVNPARLGLTKKTWSNLLSNAKAALVQAGVVEKAPRRQRLDGPWQELWDQIDDPNLKTSLSRFVALCSRLGIRPEAVSDETVLEFAKVLRASSLRKDPDLALYYLTTSWNKAAARVTGWPKKLLTVPKRRIVFKIALEAMPESFNDDLERYLDVMACKDPLAETGPSRPLSPISLAQYRRQILRFCGELRTCGVPPEIIVNLEVLVRPENVEKGLRAMLNRNGDRTSKTIYGMAYMLKVIAKHYVRLPNEQIAEIDRMCRRLRVRHIGMTEKNRARLRQFDDARDVARLLHLPGELLAGARSKRLSPKRSAMLVETALAVELLLMTALRIKNLAGLHLDRDIVSSRATRDGVCHLVVEGDQVKNGQHLEFELDGETTTLLRTFVTQYRPLLVPASSRWLFSQRDGTKPVSTTVLSQRISKTIRARTGFEVNPHLFRSLGGKLYLDRHPGGYEVVRRMLGHTSKSTTLQAYTGLESTSAAKHFDQTIRSLRDAMASPGSRRRCKQANRSRW